MTTTHVEDTRSAVVESHGENSAEGATSINSSGIFKNKGRGLRWIWSVGSRGRHRVLSTAHSTHQNSRTSMSNSHRMPNTRTGNCVKGCRCWNGHRGRGSCGQCSVGVNNRDEIQFRCCLVHIDGQNRLAIVHDINVTQTNTTHHWKNRGVPRVGKVAYCRSGIVGGKRAGKCDEGRHRASTALGHGHVVDGVGRTSVSVL